MLSIARALSYVSTIRSLASLPTSMMHLMSRVTSSASESFSMPKNISYKMLSPAVVLANILKSLLKEYENIRCSTISSVKFRRTPFKYHRGERHPFLHNIFLKEHDIGVDYSNAGGPKTDSQLLQENPTLMPQRKETSLELNGNRMLFILTMPTNILESQTILHQLSNHHYKHIKQKLVLHLVKSACVSNKTLRLDMHISHIITAIISEFEQSDEDLDTWDLFFDNCIEYIASATFPTNISQSDTTDIKADATTIMLTLKQQCRDHKLSKELKKAQHKTKKRRRWPVLSRLFKLSSSRSTEMAMDIQQINQRLHKQGLNTIHYQDRHRLKRELSHRIHQITSLLDDIPIFNGIRDSMSHMAQHWHTTHINRHVNKHLRQQLLDTYQHIQGLTNREEKQALLKQLNTIWTQAIKNNPDCVPIWSIRHKAQPSLLTLKCNTTAPFGNRQFIPLSRLYASMGGHRSTKLCVGIKHLNHLLHGSGIHTIHYSDRHRLKREFAHRSLQMSTPVQYITPGARSIQLGLCSVSKGWNTKHINASVNRNLRTQLLDTYQQLQYVQDVQTKDKILNQLQLVWKHVVTDNPACVPISDIAPINY
jgi:hypothetical protein